MKIVRDTAIEEMPKGHPANMESMEIITIAGSKIARSLPLASIDTSFDETSLSRTINVVLKSQRTSVFLDRIGSSDIYRQFSRELISGINPRNSLLYDITCLSSYRSADILECGQKQDCPDLGRINPRTALERSGNIPLFFETQSGSIRDIVTLKRIVEGIR